MNRLDVIKELSTSMASEKEAAFVVAQIFDIITTALKNKEKVVISGFGTFIPKQHLPCKRRNPKTNEEVIVGSKTTVRFKASKKLL